MVNIRRSQSKLPFSAVPSERARRRRVRVQWARLGAALQGSASCTHGGERRAGPGGERARGERTERSDASVVVVPNRANERAGEGLHSAAGAAA